MQTRINNEYDFSALLANDFEISRLRVLCRLAFKVWDRDVGVVEVESRPQTEWERLVRACHVGSIQSRRASLARVVTGPIVENPEDL